MHHPGYLATYRHAYWGLFQPDYQPNRELLLNTWDNLAFPAKISLKVNIFGVIA